MLNLLQVKYSSWLSKELDRLEHGSKPEKQRYRNALAAIAKVQANPLNPDFSKELPQNYKAVDVLQQYRLFFRIENDPALGDQVIYFVWINDESSIHRSGKPDDCYQIFRDLLSKDQIESYQPATPISKGYFKQDPWGAPFVYVRYQRIQKTPLFRAHHANATLTISKITDQEYALQSISVSEENIGLASDLLSKLCEDADQAKITLIHELFIKSQAIEKSRHLLSKAGFVCTETIEDIEIWQRRPNA